MRRGPDIIDTRIRYRAAARCWETLTISSQIAIRLLELSAGHLLLSGNLAGTHFCYRLSRPKGNGAARSIRPTENSCELIRIRIRDLPACTTVPQPTTLPRAPPELWHSQFFGFDFKSPFLTCDYASYFCSPDCFLVQHIFVMCTCRDTPWREHFYCLGFPPFRSVQSQFPLVCISIGAAVILQELNLCILSRFSSFCRSLFCSTHMLKSRRLPLKIFVATQVIIASSSWIPLYSLN
jgi:hypothetical protein